MPSASASPQLILSGKRLPEQLWVNVYAGERLPLSQTIGHVHPVLAEEAAERIKSWCGDAPLYRIRVRMKEASG